MEVDILKKCFTHSIKHLGTSQQLSHGFQKPLWFIFLPFPLSLHSLSLSLFPCFFCLYLWNLQPYLFNFFIANLKNYVILFYILEGWTGVTVQKMISNFQSSQFLFCVSCLVEYICQWSLLGFSWLLIFILFSNPFLLLENEDNFHWRQFMEFSFLFPCFQLLPLSTAPFQGDKTILMPPYTEKRP